MFEEQKEKKNEEKWKEPKGTVEHHQTEHHMHYRSLRRREKGSERIFEHIIHENFPNLMKYINVCIQEAYQTLSKKN